MKNIVCLLLFLFYVNSSFGQQGYKKFATKFYEKIDSTKSLRGCVSNLYSLGMTYDIELPEIPYTKLDLDDYENRMSEDDFIKSYVDELIEGYYDFKPKHRKSFTKTSYCINVEYVINKNVCEELFWVKANLTLKFKFQGTKDFTPWYVKLEKKLFH